MRRGSTTRDRSQGRGGTVRRRVLAALATVAALIAGSATAQYASDPFFDDTVLQSRGFGLEMMGVRLLLLETYGVAPEGLDETVEGLEADYARFGGTLTAEAPDVAADLEEAIEAIEDGFEDGADLTDLVADALEVHEAAYAVVIPAETRSSAAYRAGIMADLLLAEGGVAEGVEEAIEEDEPWMYPLGWAALQRVLELWSSLAEFATAEQDSFAEQYFDTLRDIYPAHTLPDTFPSNPEEAESPAQSLVGIIESVSDAALYPGRDVRRLAPHLTTVVAPACDAYAAGNDAIAYEHIVAVGDLYSAHLEDFLGLVAGEVGEEVSGMLAALGYAGEDDDDDGAEGEEAGEGGAGDDDGDDDDVELADDPAAACGELLEALEEASELLGG